MTPTYEHPNGIEITVSGVLVGWWSQRNGHFIPTAKAETAHGLYRFPAPNAQAARLRCEAWYRRTRRTP